MKKPPIDLRSDTVTRPCAAMRRAMAEAAVGDDVYREDPTVAELEREVAERVGMEAGLLVPSGTQANLVALLTHCGRGDAYLVADSAHCFLYEGGGAAALGGIQPLPQASTAGEIDLERAARAIRDPEDSHFAPARLLCLENTFHGRALAPSYLERAVSFARKHSLALHLDGARIFNAAVATGSAASELCAGFDSVSVCLSKGLGAPVGSVLCGAPEWVERARRWRKVVGGGMRQAGVLAAAGLVAVRQNVERLAVDHANAERLAEGLEALGPSAGVEVVRQDTNMVFVRLDPHLAGSFRDRLRERGVLVAGGPAPRLVTHLDVSSADIDRALAEIEVVVRAPATVGAGS